MTAVMWPGVGQQGLSDGQYSCQVHSRLVRSHESVAQS